MNRATEYKIIEVKWRSALHTVGFVAYDLGFDSVWNAVVGYVPAISLIPTDPPAIVIHQGTEDDDAQYIAAHGAKLLWQEAHIFFPEFDIKKFKYHPDRIKEELMKYN